jgi:hypothetical protein
MAAFVGYLIEPVVSDPWGTAMFERGPSSSEHEFMAISTPKTNEIKSIFFMIISF